MQVHEWKLYSISISIREMEHFEISQLCDLWGVYFELVILKCYETDVYLSPGPSMVLGATGLIFC